MQNTIHQRKPKTLTPTLLNFEISAVSPDHLLQVLQLRGDPPWTIPPPDRCLAEDPLLPSPLRARSRGRPRSRSARELCLHSPAPKATEDRPRFPLGPAGLLPACQGKSWVCLGVPWFSLPWHHTQTLRCSLRGTRALLLLLLPRARGKAKLGIPCTQGCLMEALFST